MPLAILEKTQEVSAGQEWDEAEKAVLIARETLKAAEERLYNAKVRMIHAMRGTSCDATHRELEVLALVKAGKTNKEIGAILFIGERTVKFHVSSLLAKFAMHHRRDL